MDRSQKLKVFQGTSQIEQTTSSVVPKVARLRFYAETYTGKDKYEGGHPFKERSSEYQERLQRCSTLERQNMAMKDNSRSCNNKRKQDSQRDQKKHNKGE